MTNKLNKLIGKILKISPARVSDKTSPVNVRRWDSFTGLLLITEIEKAYGIKLSMDEVLSIKDIGSIRKIIKSRGIDPDE